MTNEFQQLEDFAVKEYLAAKTALQSIWKDDIAPEIKIFEDQFRTDFGKMAWAAVVAAVAALVPGAPINVAELGAALLETLWNEAVSIARSDAQQVILNALRVHQVASQAAAIPQATLEENVTALPANGDEAQPVPPASVEG